MVSTLARLGEGCWAKIGEIGVSGERRRRLLDLGFTPEAEVKCLFSAPSGDPRAYMVRGTVIALRREDAGHVTTVGEALWD